MREATQANARGRQAVGRLFSWAGCPCAVRVPAETEGTDKPLIPDVKGITNTVHAQMDEFKRLLRGVQETYGRSCPRRERISHDRNDARSYSIIARRCRQAYCEGWSFGDDALDKAICLAIKQAVTCSLPNDVTPYHALARFIGTQHYPLTELFTTNYDVLMEQALEACRVPFFDGFVGSSRPFFDQRAIEDDKLPVRWSRLWKLHGSVNWRFSKTLKSVFRSMDVADGDELLIHPSHPKYDESRRMPYFVMIDRLRSFLRSNQRPVALFIIGYSFGDEHLNEAIIESLSANQSAACFALQYGDLAGYPNVKKLALDNANLSRTPACVLSNHPTPRGTMGSTHHD